MRRLIPVCLIPFLVGACATATLTAPGRVPPELLLEDPFDASYRVRCDNTSGKTICVMTGNALRPFNPRYPMLSLGLISEVGKDGVPRHFMRAVYISEDQWLNIGPESQLVITLSDHSFTISGPGSAGRRYTSEKGKRYEVALYETSAATIRRVAAAKEIRVKIKGDFLLEKHFGPVNRLYFQQFVRYYIDKTPSAAK